ncbi:insulinase family protein [uncultured Selenomonas sp.]|uniref:insulinase family protein n=1 Tax=uncultured Selenomonas sp. TaxID=159275 RepID=UPI0025F2BE3C|nr:insulinase family protein [uncultured Selenomonas sp.]
MNINDKVHGFRLDRREIIPEANVIAHVFTHEKTGARLLYLKADDDNKVFSISFRTPPTDDTGVAHIVEHSTLCGSRNYPLKEPFVELVKGSLNTFLNAMTYPDKTMYPLASRNDKDFQNLMDVYLDAVFYPAMRENPQVLMQEGWHYEIDDPKAPLRYSGVVYNEMKGALSAPDDLLESRTLQALYPDTTYHYESGGEPTAIPQLTQQMFCDFHARYYHPSNSYLFLYGDMDIDEKLEYLDSAYLSHFDRIPVPSHIDTQAPFDGLQRLTRHYPIGAGENTAEKTFLAYAFQTGEAKDAFTMTALEILEHALLRTPAAPLRKALLDSHLGKDVDSTFETDLMQPYFSIILNNSEPDRAETFRHVVRSVLYDLVNHGIDRTLLEASINLFEFKLREADFGSAPKGLIYNIRCMKSWLYDGDPTTYLYYEGTLRKLREGLDTGLFERLIRTYLLDNPHAVLLTFAPSKRLAVEKEKAVAKELAARKAAMSERDIERVIEATRALKERQGTPDSPEALATIPMLTRGDIRKAAEVLPLVVKEQDGVTLLESAVDTSGICYFQFYFDAGTVPQADLPYAYLLCALLGSVDTSKHTYTELANLTNLHTGGISFDLGAYSAKDDPQALRPKFKVKAKCFTRKLPELSALLQEILTESQFSDAKRLRELLQEEQVGIEMSLQRSAHQIVASRVAACFTNAAAYTEEGGLPYYQFVKAFLKDFDASLEKLQHVAAEILPRLTNRHGLAISLTASEEDLPKAERELRAFLPSLPAADYTAETYTFPRKITREGLAATSEVQYVGKGANFRLLGYKYSGAMHVLETLLRYGYFWTKIRVQGGAYGAFTTFRRDGNLSFGSYRDPNLKETVDIFDHTADVIADYEADDRELTKAVLGTMSNIDMPLTPRAKGAAAAESWLRGTTYEDRQQTRDEILGVTVEDIRNLAPIVDACMKQNALCVYGGEKKIEENKALFDKVTHVME